MTQTRKLLVVVDVQNDFCSREGFFAKKVGFDPSGIDPVVDNIEQSIDYFRGSDIPIVFTQAIGDKEYISRTQYERYRRMRKLGFLKNNEWGSNFYRVRPQDRELTFKKGGYDPFFNREFKDYIVGNSDQIIIVGFFSDVCIDATVRTADQLGIQTEVIGNCSDSMFRSHDESLRFMETYYGTRIFENLHQYEVNNYF